MVYTACEGEDETLVSAAYLHDIIEDCAITITQIETIFGHGVASLVAEMTDAPSSDEKERWDNQIIKAKTLSKGAALIKLADKISNLEGVLNDPPAGWRAQKILAYLKWGQDVVANLYVTDEKLLLRFKKISKDLERKYKPLGK